MYFNPQHERIYKAQGIILIWVLVVITLLSSIVLFGLDSLNRLERVFELESERTQKKADLIQTIQGHAQSQESLCHLLSTARTVRFIGFSPTTVFLGDKNGLYFYEVSFETVDDDKGWVVLSTPFPLLDLISQGRIISCSS